jgi:hypothetical protein
MIHVKVDLRLERLPGLSLRVKIGHIPFRIDTLKYTPTYPVPSFVQLIVVKIAEYPQREMIREAILDHNVKKIPQGMSPLQVA